MARRRSRLQSCMVLILLFVIYVPLHIKLASGFNMVGITDYVAKLQLHLIEDSKM